MVYTESTKPWVSKSRAFGAVHCDFASVCGTVPGTWCTSEMFAELNTVVWPIVILGSDSVD